MIWAGNPRVSASIEKSRTGLLSVIQGSNCCYWSAVAEVYKLNAKHLEISVAGTSDSELV